MRNALAPLLFFLYFNALFTFENISSTPIPRPVAKLSIEAVVLLGVLAAVVALGWRLSRLARCALALVIFLAALVRYVDVTALGVLGREFNLHGDFPHLHRVAAMFWEAISAGTGFLVVAGLLLVVLAALSLNVVGIHTWERAFRKRTLRFIALYGAPVLVGAFCLVPGVDFATPTSAIVVRQIDNLRLGEADRLAAEAITWPNQRLDGNLDGLGGAHVFLIFVESYGVTLLEDAHHFDAIEPRFRSLESRLRAAGVDFRSSQIQSPTFGGGSWRAHASFLSGYRIDSEHLYNALLRSERRTLVSVLGEQGYRTIAAEPGIKWFWPDGEFYGFDRIYAFDDLDYQGPPMGWWKIPDQFTLYRIYRNEIANATTPVFAKFALIMSHIPYFPVPEYVEDWSRFDDGSAFEVGLKSVAHDAYRDLRELSSWYVAAMEYELDILEGFLLNYAPENSLTIVVGDHQPPKLVTHDNDSWAVPMHVFSKRPELIEAFDSLGFERELVPRRPSALRMADFLERFVQIYHVPDEVRGTDE